ncbi:hypothetical protein FHS81_003570 [Pseudochelatococcus contaminans]|uniref:Uncharacterized protein n=1 Tax=Pseudochelatococcus contaminans TaxID=1538103 RepID=A0A7W5Z7V0_9HYPH|nr:hypothetical protein [Pseudochelatococcus contaminans]
MIFAKSDAFKLANENVQSMVNARPVLHDPSIANRSIDANLSSNTNINVYGADRPVEVAGLVEQTQGRTNQNIVRNFASAVR